MSSNGDGNGGEERIGIFVSHKAVDRPAALQLKRVLESESSRLDVHVYESTPAGEKWEEWIFDKLSTSQILLLLYTDPTREWDWCLYEAGLFTPLADESERPRKVVCLYRDRKPEPLRALQAIKANSAELNSQFLRPLFRDTETYLGVAPVLNDRKTDDDLSDMATRIMEALQFNNLEASYVVTTLRIDLPQTVQDELSEDTVVHSLSGPLRIFGQFGDSITWPRLVELAESDPMKGTAWQEELKAGILATARGDVPATMTATFRGKDSGHIYSSLIYRVDRRNDKPVRVYVAFVPAIVPELVRGPGAIGDVYQLVRLANRFRYEVVEPYLKRLQTGAELDLVNEKKKILESIHTILDEAQRHDMMDMSRVAQLFTEDTDQDALYRINVDWENQFAQLMALPEIPEREVLVDLLEQMKALNTWFLKLSSRRYAQMAQALDPEPPSCSSGLPCPTSSPQLESAQVGHIHA